jgi:hypothetical protein
MRTGNERLQSRRVTSHERGQPLGRAQIDLVVVRAVAEARVAGEMEDEVDPFEHPPGVR